LTNAGETRQQPTNILRSVLTILLFFVYSSVLAQKQKEYRIDKETIVKTDEFTAIRMKFDRALVNADTVVLKELLHDQVLYGHSNGWIQNKRSVIKDLYNGKIKYHSIEKPRLTEPNSSGALVYEGMEYDTIYKNIRTVNSLSQVAVTVDGEYLEIKLSVTQVWIKEKGKWQLVARQSTKIN
jgi:delta-aminolevulinic acid dehydratase/porphobilinogen synthase